MNDNDVHEFINYYRIKDIRPVHDRDSFKSVDYDIGRTASYYNDREQMIEMEIPRRSFEELVHNDKENNRMYQAQREEAFMRKQYPTIKEAYEKYRMLLELYK